MSGAAFTVGQQIRLTSLWRHGGDAKMLHQMTTILHIGRHDTGWNNGEPYYSLMGCEYNYLARHLTPAFLDLKSTISYYLLHDAATDDILAAVQRG